MSVDTNEPTREELWQVLQEARDYLHQWLEGSRIHPTYGEIQIDMSEWGKQRANNTCSVCLAGLWYLRERGWLLGEVFSSSTDIKLDAKTDRLTTFLNNLRTPLDYYYDEERGEDIEYSYMIGEKLGIDNVPDSNWRMMGALGLQGEYLDENDPEHVLAFLNWLLDRHTQPSS